MSHNDQDTSRAELWDNAMAYEEYMGRWSALVAIEFLRWLDISPGMRWLDAGCGTGILTRAILDFSDPQSIVGVDPAEQYLVAAKRWTASNLVTYKTGDVRALPVRDNSVDAAVSGLMLNFVPETGQATAAQEMIRATVIGGTVAAYVWDYAGGMAFVRAFWDAASTIDPAAARFDQGNRFPICHPENLAVLWHKAGLDAVETRAFVIPTIFEDFDDYWMPFLGGQGAAPHYLNSLSDTQQSALRDLLHKSLPASPDGSIRLTARAWAVRGQVSDDA